MITNYFKVAWRNLKRNKGYAFINVLGLSLGIACCMTIFTLVSYHLSFDQFHKNKERIYRVVTEWHDEEVDHSQAVPTPLGEAFRNDFAYTDQTARVVDYGNILVSIHEGKNIKKFQEEEGVTYAEPGYFEIFNFPLSKGNKADILSKPDEAVITEKVAGKYFGNANDFVWNTIRLNHKTEFIVTGILKDIHANTDRKQEIHLPFPNLIDQHN